MDNGHQGVMSKASIKGHPLHPSGIPFPITFLFVLPFADLAYLVTDDFFWARVAWWLAGLGFLTAAIAAMVGLVDFVSIKRVREHRAGWLHAGGNAIVLIIAFANIFVRWGSPAEAILPLGILLSAAGAVLVIFSSWYGGELTYRHLIGVTGHERISD